MRRLPVTSRAPPAQSQQRSADIGAAGTTWYTSCSAKEVYFKTARLTRLARLTWELANETLDEFSKDRGELTAAGLAFFALLSMAPLLLIAIAIAGVVLGRAAARDATLRLLQDAMGPQLADVVQEWMRQAAAAGGLASFVGGALSLWAASRFTSTLRQALNQVWNVDVALENSFRQTVKVYLRRRAFAFSLVVASGPLLLLVFASRAVVGDLRAGLLSALLSDSTVEEWALGLGQFFFSFGVVATLCLLVFRFVPDRHIGWQVAAIGGAVTAALFSVGNIAVGIYLSHAAIGAAYGVAGSLVVVLLWLYYSALMFVVGAEFTQAWAARFGPALNAQESPAQGSAMRPGH